jgi:hypothetical protein
MWESCYTNPVVGKRAVDELDREAKEKKQIIVADLFQDFSKNGRNLEDDTVKACARLSKKTKATDEHHKDEVRSLTPTSKDSPTSRTVKHHKHMEEKETNFSRETILAFRKKISDNDFFKQLQQELQNATKNLYKTRLGNPADLEYFLTIKDERLGSPMRKMLKHDDQFRDFVTEHPVKYHNAQNHSKPSTNRRVKTLMFQYPKVDELNSSVRKIRVSQTKAIRDTF